MRYLRWLIREMLAEEEVLGEPDESAEEEHEREEQAIASAVAGVTTPLGTGPTYPNKKRKKKK
tara:strand:- start:571 stop:759 length:189 start_codon:yes stop_codon:yes gene_type:complete